MSLNVYNIWTDDGVNKKNKFRSGQDRLRFVAEFYIVDSLANLSPTVNFDLTHIDWRSNSIYHAFYSSRVPAGVSEYFTVWFDYGINSWEPAWNWYQVIADVEGLDIISFSPEKFVKII